MFENWQIRIQPSLSRLGDEVVIYRKLHDGRVEVYNPISDEYAVVDHGISVKPLYFPDGISQALFDALHKRGMKPKEQSFVEGKLESQSEHLKDLRKLLKL